MQFTNKTLSAPSLSVLFDPVLIAFFGIALGFVFQKKTGFVQKTISEILLYILAPALMFSSVYSKPIILTDFILLAGAPLFVIWGFAGYLRGWSTGQLNT